MGNGRQEDRQTDRRPVWQKGGRTDKCIDIHSRGQTHTHTHTHTNWQTGSQAERQTGSQTERQTDQADKHAGSQADIQMENGWTDNQRDRRMAHAYVYF